MTSNERVSFPKDELYTAFNEECIVAHRFNPQTNELNLDVEDGPLWKGKSKRIVLRGETVPDQSKEIERLKKIIIGIEDICENCCNASWDPLLGCGLSTDEWTYCTGDGNHIYWNDKERRGENDEG